MVLGGHTRLEFLFHYFHSLFMHFVRVRHWWETRKHLSRDSYLPRALKEVHTAACHERPERTMCNLAGKASRSPFSTLMRSDIASVSLATEGQIHTGEQAGTYTKKRKADLHKAEGTHFLMSEVLLLNSYPCGCASLNDSLYAATCLQQRQIV